MYSLVSFSIMALNSRITGARSLGFSSTCFAIPSSQSFWIRWSWGSHPPVLVRRGQFDWVIEDDGTIENRPMHVMFFGYGRHDDCSEAIMMVGLAMAFSNGFAKVSVLRLRVYHGKKAMGSGFFAGFFVDAFPAFLPSRNRQMTSLVNWDGKWGWWASLETPALFPEELFMLKVRYIFTPARSNRMGTRLHLRLVYPVRIVVPVSHGMGTIQGQRANQRKRIYISRLLWSPPSVGVHSVSSAILLLKSKSGVRE